MNDTYPIPDFLRRQPPVEHKATERPMLFSSPMIRALLAGTKTQTRRIVKPQPFDDPSGHGIQWHGGNCCRPYGATYLHTSREAIERIMAKLSPYGQPGDRLWVREAFMHEPADYCWEASVSIPSRPAVTTYRADFEGETRGAGWKPSIHMPRWASRILLEITDVRVERLNEISEADARAEGAPALSHFNAYDIKHLHGFIALWESINGAGSWAANPWVWVVEFKRV